MSDRSRARVHRQQLGKAHEECRNLRNQIFELEKQIEEERKAVGTAQDHERRMDEARMALAAELAAIQAERSRGAKAPLSDAELLALSGAALLESVSPTPARTRVLQRLYDDLVYRGVLPPKADAP